MRVLITGASGMLGCSLTPALRSRGFTVVAHGHSTPLDIGGDLTDAAVTQGVLDSAEPNVIVNLVALTNVDTCEDNPDLAFRLNTQVVENIATLIEAHPKVRLVHASTDHVYDGPGPCAEEAVTLCNSYARSKFAGEAAALRVRATVLRLNFFGPSAHPNRLSFSDWLERKFRSGDDFTGFDDVLFSPLSLNSLCAALATVVRDPQPGLFNLGSHDGLSKARFAQAVAETLSLDSSHMRVGMLADAGLEAARPLDMRMDSSRFEAAFGVALPDLLSEIRTLGAGDAVAQL